MQDWIDGWLTGVQYDGMTFDVMFDSDGDPCEITSTNGDTWTDQVSDLTKRRIFSAAKEKRDAIAKDVIFDYAGFQFDAMREAA